VRPLLRAALGYQHPERPRVTAALAAPLTSTAGRRQFRRGVVDAVAGPAPRREGVTVREVGGPPSHLLGALARADCFFVVPEEITELPAGSPVEVWLLEG
jgi:molybdopterin molybdotransferase